MSCKTCGGAGQVRVAQGFFSIQQTCPSCGGAGALIEKPCRECSGRGRVRKIKTLSVKVPAGVDNGDRIRLSREGEAGRNGGPAGRPLRRHLRQRSRDLHARRPEPELRGSRELRHGGARAAAVDVPTLDGNVLLKVPAETQSGSVFRLRGKGVRSVRASGARGLVLPGAGRDAGESDGGSEGKAPCIRRSRFRTRALVTARARARGSTA